MHLQAFSMISIYSVVVCHRLYLWLSIFFTHGFTHKILDYGKNIYDKTGILIIPVYFIFSDNIQIGILKI